MNEEVVTIRLSKLDINRIDIAVENGYYTNRSDFIRTAIRKHADEVVDIPEAIKRTWEIAKRKGITHEDVIKWSKEAGKEAHRRNRKQ